MTFALDHRDFACAEALPNEAAAKKPGILRRLFDSYMETRQRQSNRDIARFIADSGGRITDDVERRMGERFLTGNRNFMPE